MQWCNIFSHKGGDIADHFCFHLQMQAWILTSPASHLFNLSDLCKFQFITNGALIHWSISSESDLATRNGFSLFIGIATLYRVGGVLKVMRAGVFGCRSDVFHSSLVVHRPSFIRWQSVILLKSRPVAFSTRDFVISLEIVDKGWIFWSGVKLAGIWVKYKNLNWFCGHCVTYNGSKCNWPLYLRYNTVTTYNWLDFFICLWN